MRLRFKNDGPLALHIIVEPIANEYEVLPGEEVVAEGELALENDRSFFFSVSSDDGASYIVLYEAQDSDVIVTKNGLPLEPWN
jgi:hypothetical protein